MKKILLLLFVLAGFCLSAQTTCQSAAPFCAGGTSGVTFPATTLNPVSNAPAGPYYGCLYTTPNAAWYFMQIANSGSLSLLIQGQINGSAGQDVDFICWGPFSSLANVCSNLTSTNVVDCSYSGSYTETLHIPNGVAGQYYMVLITNFANVTQDIVFNQLNNGTTGAGNTDCSLLSVANTAICAGSIATVVATNSGNLTNPTYSITSSGYTGFSTNGTFTLVPSVTTTYTMSVTGNNSSGATVTQTALTTVSVNPQPAVAPTFTQITCTNTLNATNLHLTFNPAAPVPSYTITWSAFPGGISSPTTYTANNIMPSPYSATIVAAGGCSVATSFTMTTPPAPASFTLIPLVPIYSITCTNTNVIVTANNAGLTYTWTNGVTAPITPDSQILINAPGGLGTWSVTATNPVTGCMATHTFVVAINTITPTGSVSPSFQNITCVSTASTVSVSAQPTVNVEHNIYSPQGVLFSATSHTAIYVPGGPGLYTDTILNMVNGCYIVKTFSVASSDNFPLIDVSSTTNYTIGCVSHSLTQITLGGTTFPNTGGAVSYTILPPGNPGTSYVTGAASVYTLSVPGPYTAVVEDITNHCRTTIPFSVVQNIQGPNIGYTADTTILSCYQPTAQLTATTTNGNSFSWTYPGPNGTNVTTTNPFLTVNTTTNVTNTTIGVYTLNITSSMNGCTSTTTLTMRQNLAAPIASITANATFVTCNTQTVQLTNFSHTGILPASGFPSNQIIQVQLWEGPPPQTPNQLVTNYIAATPGQYTMTVKDLNNGCTAKATLSVSDNRVYPVANTPLTPSIAIIDCGALSTTITVNPDRKDKYAYTWTKPDVNAFSEVRIPSFKDPVTGDTIKDPFVVKNPGVWRAVITNTVTGCSSTGAATVITGSLTAQFAPSQISGYAPMTVNFTNQSASSGANGSSSITSVWSFGNGFQTTTTTNINAQAIYTQPGTYSITMFSQKGVCQASVTHTIFVDVPSKLEIPNVFTPNDDGVNDIFFLKTANLTDINALIYDRWGHKVYELDSPTGNIAWDGTTLEGKKAAAGTYFYIIKATGLDGKSYDNKGTLTLYR